jgi:hypothetical protein
MKALAMETSAEATEASSANNSLYLPSISTIFDTKLRTVNYAQLWRLAQPKYINT